MSKRKIFLTVLFLLIVIFGALLWKGYADLREFQAEVARVKAQLKPFADSDITTDEQREVVRVCSQDRAVAKEFPPAKIPDYCRCLGVNIVSTVYPMVPAEHRHLTQLVQLGKSYNQALASTVVVRENCRHQVMPEEQDVSPAGVRAPVEVPGIAAPMPSGAPGIGH